MFTLFIIVVLLLCTCTVVELTSDSVGVEVAMAELG